MSDNDRSKKTWRDNPHIWATTTVAMTNKELGWSGHVGARRMSAKGYITGNDAADRILRGEVPCSEEAMRRVLTAERNLTIASLRSRLSRIPRRFHDVSPFVIVDDVERVLDEMEPMA